MRKFQIFLLFLLAVQILKSQNLSKMDRQPAVAGRFYPASEQVLNEQLADFFKNAVPRKLKNTVAVISPHAGYVFSGQVAASAFNQIDPNKQYNTIFLIGTSHHTYLKGASIYNLGDYILPNGKVPVNLDIANKLIENYDFFEFNPYAHKYEHSLEVQLPFLIYHLKHPFKIVPIIIGTENIQTIQKIAQALKPYFATDNNLFVISTDFSHYPPYEYAVEVDSATAQAIASNNPDEFLKVIKKNKSLNIPDLATSICGWSSVLTLLYITSSMDDIKYHLIQYKNSGDSPYGDKYQVVGYYAIAVEKIENTDFQLTDQEKQTLLEISRQTLEDYIRNGQIPNIDEAKLTENLKKPLGAFVTLKKNGKLRGCIGRFMPSEPLYQVVQDMTIASATEDSRFPPVQPDELDSIDIEISVLTPLQPVKDPLKEIKVGRDGVYIMSGFRTGTLLPQVAVENNWDVEQFLGYCSKYKAGLGWDGWRNAEVYKYQAIVFSESDFKK